MGSSPALWVSDHEEVELTTLPVETHLTMSEQEQLSYVEDGVSACWQVNGAHCLLNLCSVIAAFGVHVYTVHWWTLLQIGARYTIHYWYWCTLSGQPVLCHCCTFVDILAHCWHTLEYFLTHWFMGHQLLHWFIGVLSLSPTHCCTVIIQLLHMTQISVHVGAHCFKLVHIGV